MKVFCMLGLKEKKKDRVAQKTLQTLQAYVEALKCDKDMLSAAISCHEQIHTHMHTETRHFLLIEYSGIQEDFFRRKVRREVEA